MCQANGKSLLCAKLRGKKVYYVPSCKNVKRNLTASVLKQDPNTQKVQMNTIYLLGQKRNLQIFGVVPLSSYKSTLKQKLNFEKQKLNFEKQ